MNPETQKHVLYAMESNVSSQVFRNDFANWKLRIQILELRQQLQCVGRMLTR